MTSPSSTSGLTASTVAYAARTTNFCALAIVGVTARGKKRFLAIEDGVRESAQSWRKVLLSLKSRGMNAPKLAIRDGAMNRPFFAGG